MPKYALICLLPLCFVCDNAHFAVNTSFCKCFTICVERNACISNITHNTVSPLVQQKSIATHIYATCKVGKVGKQKCTGICLIISIICLICLTFVLTECKPYFLFLQHRKTSCHGSHLYNPRFYNTSNKYR